MAGNQIGFIYFSRVYQGRQAFLKVSRTQADPNEAAKPGKLLGYYLSNDCVAQKGLEVEAVRKTHEDVTGTALSRYDPAYVCPYNGPEVQCKVSVLLGSGETPVYDQASQIYNKMATWYTNFLRANPKASQKPLMRWKK